MQNNHLHALGVPIPPGDPHAVSVSLPTWRDVVGYEENDPATHQAMQAGYPRFFLLHVVRRLRERYRSAAGASETVWLFPSLRVAGECAGYVGDGRVQATNDGIALAIVPQDKDAKAKEFWQHSGLYVSSRQAENALAGRKPVPGSVLNSLKKLIAEIWQADAQDVFLAPTGMGAIFSAYKAVTSNGNSRTIQLGFPYLDILKIQERFGNGFYLRYDRPQDLKAVEEAVQKDDIAAVFCEIPGNPLLRTIDLEALHALLKPRHIPLVIDDTIGTPFDIDIKPYADIIVTSLTKFFCGKGNVTGGSAILNRASPHYERLRAALFAREELLYPDDAEVLLASGQGFAQRMAVINRNAEKLAAFLALHPAVETVFYTRGDPAYEAIRREKGGYGGLISFVLKDKKKAPLVYDNLQVCKGPSIGTEFTLVCPYTLLAHYGELDWAEASGVSRYLLRVSVGTEDGEEIIKRFEEALKVAV